MHVTDIHDPVLGTFGALVGLGGAAIGLAVAVGVLAVPIYLALKLLRRGARRAK